MFIPFLAALLLQVPPFPFPAIPLPMPRVAVATKAVRADPSIGYYLLNLPLRTPLGDMPEELRAIISKSVQDAAIALEIMDERERAYQFSVQPYFAMETDLDLLRARKADLEGTPRLGEAEWLPERSVANDFVKFNRAFRKQIQSRMEAEADRQIYYQKVLDETDACYRAWDYVRDARCEFYYTVARRQALKKLVAEIGREAFDKGELPDYVPRWRFNDLR